MSEFTDLMTRERDRLNSQRETLMSQQAELQEKIESVDREFAAIEAYEAAKDGRAPLGRISHNTAAGGTIRRRARRGSKREDLLQLIRSHPNGLKRGEILDLMGLKGDRSGEMSVSNALTALTKSNTIHRREGKYVVAA